MNRTIRGTYHRKSTASSYTSPIPDRTLTPAEHCPPSTKTLLEIHTRGCRVRRKRERLTSNGSIESDAAVSRRSHRSPSRRVTSDRVLAFLDRHRVYGLLWYKYGVKLKTALAVVFVLLFGTAPQAAVAQTQAEMNEAACAKFKRADAELDRVYQQILGAKAKDADFVKAFQDAQTAWVAFRDAHLTSIFPDPNPRAYGSVYPLCRCGFLEQVTIQRANELRRLWIIGIDEGDVCTGSCTVKSARVTPKRKK